MKRVVTLVLCAIFSGVVTGTQWVSIGPTMIEHSSSFFFGQGPVSGRVSEIAVDPRDDKHWLVGAAFGGVWETRDAGSTWQPRTDNQPTLAMGSIAFAASDPNIVYAGTGEAVSFGGEGVLKSFDGGETWQQVSSYFAGASFSDIKVDPGDSETLVVATTVGRKPNRFSPRIPEHELDNVGIFKSTDGGRTWMHSLLSGQNRKLIGRATDLEVVPGDYRRQYAGVGHPKGKPFSQSANHASNGVYRSTDKGSNWHWIRGPWENKLGGVGRVEIAISPSNPAVTYVVIQDAMDTDPDSTISRGIDGALLGIWYSVNAWDSRPSWIEIRPPGGLPTFLGTQTYYDLEIIVDPYNPFSFYVGGVGLYKWTYSRVPAWVNTQNFDFDEAWIHVDQHTMAWSGNRLLVGNDGGVYSTVDGGVSWENHNTNLVITQLYYGSVHPDDSNFLIGGSQDNGVIVRTGKAPWRAILSGDGMDSAISSTSPETDWVVSAQNGSLFRTLYGGVTVESAGTIPGNFYTHFEKCPSNNNMLIAFGGRDPKTDSPAKLWKTEDMFSAFSPVWMDNNSPLVRTASSAIEFFSDGSFAESDVNCNIYAIGTSTGQVFLTENRGGTWREITPTIMNGKQLIQGSIVDVAFNPINPNVFFVTNTISPYIIKTGRLLDNVFNTQWLDVSPKGMIAPPNSFLVDNLNPNNIFVGTQRGVWFSIDGGSTWAHMGSESGMPNVPVYDLQKNTLGNVFAFTYGRGVYRLDEFLGLTPIKRSTSTDELDLLGEGGILDKLYGLANLMRVPDNVDHVWINHKGISQAKGRNGFATDVNHETPRPFGFIGSARSDIGSIGNLELLGAFPEFTIGNLPSNESLPAFHWGIGPTFPKKEPIWSSLPRENSDDADHSVTWFITSGPSKGNHVVAWEDASDGDFNDLVIEVSKVAPLKQTPVLSSLEEPDLLGVNGILDDLCGLENLMRISDSDDQYWENRDGGTATARARYSGDPSETLEYIDLNNVRQITLTERGEGANVSASGTLPSVSNLPTFRWGLEEGFSAKPSDNADGADHMVTWEIIGEPCTVGNYLIAWEDRDIPASDQDYQDLVVEVSGVSPLAQVIDQLILPLEDVETDYFPSDPRAPAGAFVITATFTNNSATAINNPFFSVVGLSGGNTLLNADGGAGGVGATLTPNVGSDGVLLPGEKLMVTFEIGLQEPSRFTFFVDLFEGASL